MRIQVSGKHIDVGDALRAHVSAALEEAASKYAGRPTEATAVFARDGFAFSAEVTMHLSTGLTAQARGQNADVYAAFEAARERIAKQLRRHKRRLKDHNAGRAAANAGPVSTVPAGSYVLAPFADDPDDEVPVPEGLGGNTDDGPGDGAPTIIAETETALPSLSVGEAVMQMELAHAPVLVFRDAKRGGLNVVYRRDDGNIGWIDPRGLAEDGPAGGGTAEG